MKWGAKLNEPSKPEGEELQKKEAYYKLGQISTLFAEMEEGFMIFCGAL